MTPVLHVILQYCHHADPARQAEFDECVLRNLNNRQVIAVHDFVEPGVAVPPQIATHPKYRSVTSSRWLTFADAITYANDKLSGQTVALLNLDIFLADEGVDWAAALRLVSQSVVLCLSRVEWDGAGGWHEDPSLKQAGFAYSQDCWVFKAPLGVADCDFEIGLPGCDNAFAARIRRSNLIPLNWHTKFRIYHYDRARGKTAANDGTVHQADAARRPANRHPEQIAQYPVPAVGAYNSFDDLVKSLGLADLERYQLMCDILARYRTVVSTVS